jgi:hypothetical protein
MGEPINDHAVHDCEIIAPAWGAQEIGNTGFRFVRIDLLDVDAEIELIAVRAVSLMRPVEFQGSFQCSDPLLNTVWETAARTVHLCMQDYVWDGIKRDRLVWIGDLHPETMVISSVFGAQKIVPLSLDYVRDTTPLPNWMNGIPSYSLWWILIQRDWYRYSGDLGYLKGQQPYLVALLSLLDGFIGEDGIGRLPGNAFLDWSSAGDEKSTVAGLHALLHMAVGAGASLCRALGNLGAASIAEGSANRMMRHVPALAGLNKQAASLLALAGLHSAEDANEQVMAVNPLAGLSPFYGYYVMQARAAAGDIAGCLEMLRKYWGGMLDMGATSFWEAFDLSWIEGNPTRIDQIPVVGRPDIHADFGEHCYKGLRHSLCHGWAGGPAAWLIEHVLGISPVEPGCRVVRVAPNLGDLDYAEGSLATPFGCVRVRHVRQPSGAVTTAVDAPRGITIERVL